MQLRRLAAAKATLGILQQVRGRGPEHSVSPRFAVTPKVVARKSQEDQKMSNVTSTASTSRTSTALAARVCSSCKNNPLSYNNTTGICGECQGRQGGRVRSKKTDGHEGVQPFGRGLKLPTRQVAQPMATEPAKPTASDHSDTPCVDGNRAQPGEGCVRSLEKVHIESRVDLLLAAVPYEAKAKMLSAWLSGTL